MTVWQSDRRRRRAEGGFTLAELLLVIVIMGVLASVVVFGALQFGTKSPCQSDARMLRNAEATYFVANAHYATQAELTAARLIVRPSTLHDVTPAGLSFTVTELGQCVGSGTADADSSSVVLPITAPGITVLVTASDGQPVTGVTAEYRAGNGAWQSIGSTGSTGTANAPVPAGTYDVRAKLYGVASTVSSVQVGVGTLVYVSTLPLTAQILTWSGSQIPGVLMNASPAGQSSWFSFGPTTVGAGATAQVLPGVYDVETSYHNVTAQQNDEHVLAATTVTFHTAPLTVQVVDGSGAGVAGATVTLTPDTDAALATQTTGVDGKVVVDLLPWTYGIVGEIQLQPDAQVHTVTLDSVPTTTDPEVVQLTVNR